MAEPTLSRSWQDMTDEEEGVGLGLLAAEALAEQPEFHPWDEANAD